MSAQYDYTCISADSLALSLMLKSRFDILSFDDQLSAITEDKPLSEKEQDRLVEEYVRDSRSRYMKGWSIC